MNVQRIIAVLTGRRVKARFALIWIFEHSYFHEVYRDKNDDWFCTAEGDGQKHFAGPCMSRADAVLSVARDMGFDGIVN